MPQRQYFVSVPSTQEPALELARRGADPGTRVVAGEQGSGRGRHDHAWASPPGGLYVSIVREGRPEAGPFLSLAVGACLCDRIRTRWGPPVKLRWPNDIVCPHPRAPATKLGGVLVEGVQGSDGYRTVVGIGLNVHAPLSAFPAGIRSTVCTFGEDFGITAPLGEFEREVTEAIAELFTSLASEAGRARYRARARELLYGRGLAARIDGVAVGVIEGLGEDGSLLVRNETGTREFLDGTLTLAEGSS